MSDVKEYTVDDVKNQIKPLSKNAFVRFFQKIWRWWLGVWYGFADKHPKGSSIIYKIFFLIVFSEGVTIFQFLVMTFLPYAFQSMWDQPFVWPAVSLGLTDGSGSSLFYAIFNEPVKFIVAGAGENGKDLVLLASDADRVAIITAQYGDKAVLQASGLGNFIAFEIAVFLAQCINFPLQRNITYRSHGNPWYQAMWYFIGWVLVSIFTNAVWGICNPLMMSWNWNEVVIGLIKTVLTGGVSLVIFFFIFLVIFPDNNKLAKSSRAKYEKLVKNGASEDKIAAAEAKMRLWEDKALKSNSEKDCAQAKSQVNSKAMKYFAVVKSVDKAKTEEEKVTLNAKVEKSFNDAVEAIKTKEEKEAIYNAVLAGEYVPETQDDAQGAAEEANADKEAKTE